MRGARLLPIVLVAAWLGGCASGPDRAALLELGAIGECLARTLCADSPPADRADPNRHVPGQIDRLETRACGAGRATRHVGASTSDPGGLALAVTVRAAGAGLPTYLEIGAPLDRAMRVLGPPATRSGAALGYPLDEEGSATVTVHHAGGRVAGVEWAWVVD